MKFIVKLLFLLLPILAFSQDGQKFKNGIGIHLTQDGLGGLGTSVRYTRQIANQGILKFEFKSNWEGGYAGRIGYEFLQIRLHGFELGFGFDVKYRHANLERYGQTNFQELAFELPIELRYQLSKKYSLQSGISFAKRVRGTEGAFYSSTSLAELRFGIGYNF